MMDADMLSETRCSPQARGLTAALSSQNFDKGLFPASTGINRLIQTLTHIIYAVPRKHGD